MDKDDWKSFFRFLDEASDREIRQKLTRVEATLKQLRSASVRSDVRRMQRLLEQELVAREGLTVRREGRR